MIYIKTELGKTALHDKSLGLGPKQRSAFIMFDGKRTADEVLKLTTALGVTSDDINHLVSLGLLAAVQVATAGNKPGSALPPVSVAPAASASATGLPVSDAPGLTHGAQAHYAKAYPIAVRLTSNLGLRGFRLNLAVEAAGDLDKLKDLAPKIKDAVGAEKYKELDEALNF